MERQNRLMTVLASILLVLVAIAVFATKPDTDDAVDPDAPPERKLFAFEADEALSLKLVNASGTLTFEKQSGTWTLTAPRAAPVEERRVTEILDRIAGLKAQERSFERNLVDFGLDEAQRVRVDIGLLEGKSVTLFVGRDSPIGYHSYVAEKGDGPALLASARIGDLVNRTPDDFRSKEVWKVSAATAHRIRIEDAGRSVVLRKDAHGWWLGDDGPRADAEAVDDWLPRAGMLRAETFLDGGDPLALGLQPAATTLTIDDDSGTHVLKLGNRDDSGVDAETGAGLVRLRIDALEVIKLEGWIASGLLPVRLVTVDTVDIQLGDKKARLTKGDTGWVDASGAASTGADALLEAIDAARGERDTEAPALGAVWGHITLSEGTNRTETITLGDLLADGARAARDEAGGPVFRVPAESLTALAGAVP